MINIFLHFRQFLIHNDTLSGAQYVWLDEFTYVWQIEMNKKTKERRIGSGFIRLN